MFLKQIEIGPMANYAYLLGDPESKTAAIVDPAWDVPALLRAAEESGYRIGAALVTHNHFDHINGIPDLLKSLDIPVYAHAKDAGEVPAAGNLKPVSGGDKIRLGSLEISFLHTPGHTAGSQCFMVQDSLITGDTLFINGCGRVDLPSSDPAQMRKSLSRIAALPDRVVVWPGHNYSKNKSASIKDQKATNRYLRGASKSLEDFMSLMGG